MKQSVKFQQYYSQHNSTNIGLVLNFFHQQHLHSTSVIPLTLSGNIILMLFQGEYIYLFFVLPLVFTFHTSCIDLGWQDPDKFSSFSCWPFSMHFGRSLMSFFIIYLNIYIFCMLTISIDLKTMKHLSRNQLFDQVCVCGVGAQCPRTYKIFKSKPMLCTYLNVSNQIQP